MTDVILKRSVLQVVGVAWLALSSLVQAQDDASDSVDSLDPFSIVILPVKVRSTETGMDELAGVILAELQTLVGEIDGLHIVEPDLVEPYAESGLDAEAIARELGAATVLESSLSARPNGYQIRYAFIDAQDGNHYSNGGMLGRGKWGPDFALDTRVRETLARNIGNLETSLFPDRRTTDYEALRAEARTTLLNTGMGDAERLAALRALQPGFTAEHPGYADGGASLTGDIAVASIQLATDSPNPFVRASVWHVMRWVPDSNLIEPLLHALAHDEDAKVRKAAAMALENHRGSANVVAALRNAAKTDRDPDVRSEAEFSAADAEEQFELLSRAVMDPTLRDSERRYALIRLVSKSPDIQLAIDSPLVSAALEWVETAERPDLRNSIWWNLHQLVGAPVVEPVIDALFTDPSENTREALADLLSKYLDEPGVRDALRKVKANDDSPLVTAAATCALQGGGWCQ